MFNSWLALTFQAAQLGLETQSVMTLRLMKLSRGGTRGATEARLMVSDKLAAMAEAQFAVATTVLAGNSHDAAEQVFEVFSKRVRANQNRLSRRRRS